MVDTSRFDESFLARTLHKRRESGDLSLLPPFEDSLTISYSEFFRNPLTYATLEKLVLPLLVAQARGALRKELRFWTSACASGQEAYSLAMLLEELRNHGAEELNYRIFATDLNAQQIAKAQRGQYSADEVKNLTVRRLGNWLVRQDDSYHIVPVLRDRIEFSVFDLFDQSLSSPPGSIFGDFDLILCANVLMYYNEESRSAILKKSESSLTDGGLFVTDEAERGLMVAHGWREVYQQTAIFRSDR